MEGSRIVRFEDKLDTMLLISGEMIENHGEDSFCCLQEKCSALVSVFDGCGGLGSRTYPEFQGYTGAYMASRLVSGAVCDWYRAMVGDVSHDSEEALTQLKEYIRKVFALAESYTENSFRICGSMVRDLPTTAAIAIAQEQKAGLVLHVIWAGDSRVYRMDARGLAQLTKDDVDIGDALSNLTEDGVLTNVLSSDGRYELHYKRLAIEEPTVVFAATDGCFGYISSPMEFEHMILRALDAAQTPEEFREQVSARISEVAGDDYALGMMSFLYGSFANLKAGFVTRRKELERKYISPLQADHSDDLVRRLWQEYRRDYERDYER